MLEMREAQTNHSIEVGLNHIGERINFSEEQIVQECRGKSRSGYVKGRGRKYVQPESSNIGTSTMHEAQEITYCRSTIKSQQQQLDAYKNWGQQLITFLGEKFPDSDIPQPPTCVNPSPPSFDATSLTHPPTITEDVCVLDLPEQNPSSNLLPNNAEDFFDLM